MTVNVYKQSGAPLNDQVYQGDDGCYRLGTQPKRSSAQEWLDPIQPPDAYGFESPGSTPPGFSEASQDLPSLMDCIRMRMSQEMDDRDQAFFDAVHRPSPACSSPTSEDQRIQDLMSKESDDRANAFFDDAQTPTPAFGSPSSEDQRIWMLMSKESEDRENAFFDDAQRAASASRCPSSEDQRTRNLKNSLMNEELNKRLEAEQRDRSDSSDSSIAMQH